MSVFYIIKLIFYVANMKKNHTQQRNNRIGTQTQTPERFLPYPWEKSLWLNGSCG